MYIQSMALSIAISTNERKTLVKKKEALYYEIAHDCGIHFRLNIHVARE